MFYYEGGITRILLFSKNNVDIFQPGITANTKNVSVISIWDGIVNFGFTYVG